MVSRPFKHLLVYKLPCENTCSQQAFFGLSLEIFDSFLHQTVEEVAHSFSTKDSMADIKLEMLINLPLIDHTWLLN